MDYGNATEFVTFLQNHDVGLDNDFRFRFKGEQWMAAAAYNLLWTVRGIPCLYFGEEIESMKGAPQDVAGNDDTLESTGRAYFGDHIDDEHIAETQNPPPVPAHPAPQSDLLCRPPPCKGPHEPPRRVGLRPLLRPRLE